MLVSMYMAQVTKHQAQSIEKYKVRTTLTKYFSFNYKNQGINQIFIYETQSAGLSVWVNFK